MHACAILTLACLALWVLLCCRPRPRTSQLVVARYAEDLEWLARPPFSQFDSIVVYDKNDKGDRTAGNPPPHATVVPLPNVGREVHTYLHHVVANYDSLADVTLFLMGSCPSNAAKWAKALWTADHAARTLDSAFPDESLSGPLHEVLGSFTISTYTSTHPGNARLNPESAMLLCPQRPLRAWMHTNGLPPVDGVTYQGVFAVSREHVHQHPREWYANLLRYVDHHSNPEAAHYLERAWLAVFDPIPDECRRSMQ